MRIGAEIRRRRKALGLTLQDVVDRMDMDFDTGNLSRAERGQQEFTRKSLESVVKALDTTVAELYGTAAPEASETRAPLPFPMAVAEQDAGYNAAVLEDLRANWSTESIRALVEKLTTELPEADQLALASLLIQRARESRRG